MADLGAKSGSWAGGRARSRADLAGGVGDECGGGGRRTRGSNGLGEDEEEEEEKVE